MDDMYIRGKDKRQLVNELLGTAQPGSPVHEQQKMAIIVAAVEDLERALASLETSMNRNAESADRLAQKVFWLNVILTAATVVGAVGAVWSLLGSIRP